MDLLRLPLLGGLLKRHYGRLLLQIPFLLIALLLIYDGFTGPQSAARNLATLVPWVHYRGFIVLALLLVGNIFCMGCPFTLPRTLAKRLSLRGRRFPRVLRNKWVSIGGLFGLFFLYEWLDLWASPALTAWVIVAYFVAAFALEAWFAESPFCKYVCPLGAFNFAYATAAPTRITVRDRDVCRTCVGKECINGSYAEQPVIRIDQIGTGGEVIASHTNGPRGTLGCGTLLFPPQMTSNLDCTLCLDCARACPHDNIALRLRPPGAELSQPRAWRERWDYAFLIILLAFMGLTNAFGMVPPVYGLLQSVADLTGIRSEFVLLLLFFGVSSLLIPAVLTLATAWLSRALGGASARLSLRAVVAAFAPAFVPIGLGVWIAHYGFHFFIGALTIIPAVQNFLIDHGITLLGAQPNWALAEITDFGFVGLIQVVALVGGFGWTLLLAQGAALRLYRRNGLFGLLPWALLFLGMIAFAVWLFGLPMEMRGSILLH